MAYFYVLCSDFDRSVYIGSTKDMERRFAEHQRGQTRSTRYGIPWRILLCWSYPSYLQAVRVERQIKAWKRKDAIERLIREGAP